MELNVLKNSCSKNRKRKRKKWVGLASLAPNWFLLENMVVSYSLMLKPIWNHIFNFINSMSLKCAIELGIPDIIHNHGKPMNLSELTAALPIHHTKARNIYRLMRILNHSWLLCSKKNWWKYWARRFRRVSADWCF